MCIRDSPEPEKKSNAGAILAVLLILAAGGGAAVYFLVLKPKQGKKVPADLDAVSYTHLDVYKRQMNALSICIMLVIYGRMIEVYWTTSVGPIPLATMTNRDWSHTGQNYLKSLFALAFQAFLIMAVSYTHLDVYKRQVLAIPRDILPPAQQADLIRDYCREFFVSKGLSLIHISC